jgi:hypothetical protein
MGQSCADPGRRQDIDLALAKMREIVAADPRATSSRASSRT